MTQEEQPDRANASEAVKNCAESIKQDNPDMDESTAFAVCQDLENKGQLQAAGRDDDGARQNSVRLHRTLEIRNPGDIERHEEDSGAVRYTDIELLAPGVWTDAASEETIDYTAEAIQDSVDNWEDNVLNLLHDQNEVSEVGRIDTAEVYADDGGSLYGDIILDGESSASEYAIELMDAALDPTEDSILGGPSVEIVDDETEFDRERGLERVVEMTFGGVGLVTKPASRTVAFDNQVAERAVAMAAATNDTDNVRIMKKELEDLDIDSSDLPRLAEELDTDEDDLTQALMEVKELQDDDEDDDDDEEEVEVNVEDDEEEDEEEEMQEEEEDDDEELSMEEVRAHLENLGERLSEIEDRVLSEDDVAEQLEEYFSEIDNRLSAIEDEPQQKGLAASGSNIDDGEDNDEEIIVGETPRTTHDGYY